MPQLDVLTYMSQFFWFFIGFWALYVVSFRYFLVPTALALKIREYLSYSNEKVVSESTFSEATLPSESESQFEKLNVMYGTLVTDYSLGTVRALDANISSLDKETKTFLLNQTGGLPVRYALNKACIDQASK